MQSIACEEETVLDEIKRRFGVQRLQYVCVAQELKHRTGAPHLHVQIILKVVMNKKTWFLDDITGMYSSIFRLTSHRCSETPLDKCRETLKESRKSLLYIGSHCNYQVTKNDRAWNEYIEKELNYIEFCSFKSTSAHHPKQWTTSAASQGVAAVESEGAPPSASRRVQALNRRAYEKDIAEQAFQLARNSIDSAMELIQKVMPLKFLSHSTWYGRSTCHERHRTFYLLFLGITTLSSISS